MKPIRAKAKIEAGSDGMYGLAPGMSVEEMREAIRHERCIEMAFEEQRYWDIRHWEIAEEVANGPLHGVQIVRQPDSSYQYQTVEAARIIFTASKMYLYPIPYGETISEPALTQNPGWQ